LHGEIDKQIKDAGRHRLAANGINRNKRLIKE